MPLDKCLTELKTYKSKRKRKERNKIAPVGVFML
jgi:hypothetical protein